MQAQRASAFNTLDFGAIAVTASARFAYNSSISLNVFKDNNSLIYSAVIVTLLQILLTYTPGLNTVIFSMKGMDGIQWGITIMFMFAVFFVMEAEKALRRVLKAQGKDTDDRDESAFDPQSNLLRLALVFCPRVVPSWMSLWARAITPNQAAVKKVDAEINMDEVEISKEE